MDKQEFIQQAARRGHVRWTSHARRELLAELLLAEEVVQALTGCEVIEDYPKKTRYLPDGLVLGWLTNGKPVHAVIGCDEPNERILIITVYNPTSERWEDDYKTRKPGNA